MELIDNTEIPSGPYKGWLLCQAPTDVLVQIEKRYRIKCPERFKSFYKQLKAYIGQGPEDLTAYCKCGNELFFDWQTVCNECM